MGLTTSELRAQAPAVFATKPAPHCSPRFTMIPTIEIIDRLAAEGWEPVQAVQVYAPPKKDEPPRPNWDAERHLHCLHRVTLRAAGSATLTQRAMAAGAIPELALFNSSDGTSQITLKQARLRLACTNGLLVSDTASVFAFNHRTITAADVIDRVRVASQRGSEVIKRIKHAQATVLTPAQQLRFARQALALRVGEEDASRYDPRSVLEVRRPEDADPTLWNIFNRAQEAGVKGLITGHSAADPERAVKLRKLESIAADTAFNTQLWALMEEFAA